MKLCGHTFQHENIKKKLKLLDYLVKNKITTHFPKLSMNGLVIKGEVVLFCNNELFKACITQALGLQKTKANKTPTHPPQTTTDKKKDYLTTTSKISTLFEEQFDYYEHVIFFSTTQFENVMVDDSFFYKNSFHENLIEIKESYEKKYENPSQQDKKNGQKTKDIAEIIKLPLETIVVSHCICEIDKTVLKKITSNEKVKHTPLQIIVHTGRRSRSSSISEGQTFKILQPKTKINDIKKHYKTLTDIQSKHVPFFFKNEQSETTNMLEQDEKSLDDVKKTEKSVSSLGSDSTSDEKMYKDVVKKINTMLSEFDNGNISNFDCTGSNFIPTFVRNDAFTNIYDSYSHQNWEQLLMMIKTYGFSLPDAREFTTPYVVKKSILPHKNNEEHSSPKYIGISTSILHESEIACVDMNLCIPTDNEAFAAQTVRHILNSINDEVGTDNTSSSAASDSEPEEEEEDEEGTNLKKITDMTGIDKEENSDTKEFDISRPKSPLCYIVFVNLEENEKIIKDELEGLFSKIKQIIAVDALPNFSSDMFKVSNTEKPTAAKKIRQFVLQHRFTKNKIFVVVIGHCKHDFVINQIQLRVDKTKVIVANQPLESCKPFIPTKQKEGVKTSLYNVEQNMGLLTELGQRHFGNSFVFYNIDCTIPLQIVMTFQKISTIILRQHTLKTEMNKNTRRMDITSKSKTESGIISKPKYEQNFATKDFHVNVNDGKLLRSLAIFFC